ncbi:MAG: hypothetical protein M3N31_09115, partial [Actinomycetota bacterium]|nr:hypothetical protein [Actinomycetota bacterium]
MAANLTLAAAPAGDPVTYDVVDAGVAAGGAAPAPGERVYLVVRNDYLSLHRAVAAGAGAAGTVLVSEPGRALGVADVEAVLGPVAA